MRKIICRFDNQQAVDKFYYDNDCFIDKTVKEYNLDTDELKRKRETHSTIKPNEDWKKYWIDMPEFIQPKSEAYAKIDFSTNKSSEELSKIFQQNITDRTKSVWFPKLKQHTKTYFRVVGNGKPKYPIYVVSKGRADLSKCLTAKWLNQMEVDHYIVVEPNEVQKYQNVFKDKPYSHILTLDMKYKDDYDTLDDRGDTIGKGPGGTRNFCWEHSMKNGYKYHWVMDDNIDCFHYLNHNCKYKVRTGLIFQIAEDFFTRFDNVAMASLNYSKFAKEIDRLPAYITNTRMYSCIFIRNDIPFRWRGRYNEDTIISLDALSNGWCTIQLNAFLADKLTTQRIKGGNNDMFYEKEGTYNKSKMLVDTYPQYATLVEKFHRIHHHVDYSSFEQKLHYREDYQIPTNIINDYGMRIVKIPEEWSLDVNTDCNSYILKHIDECEILH